ncbi:hybrid sensor histidine kinase/response regulator [[Phormidium ambiguum] IAM M-71]|uniref:histidine kinase n=1 Tax=[Phormidium ambiguum] IAM M-71 TaxID=454136 RepID=A0A1U7IIK9_9CYAN|nr:hybrid sensor histidine kinase/response regulator [Phormidium ambiguum]OKH37009.1 hybrid sensor histidine kinase/response regulator [Phormidium ambiguum IAM M-71]
MNSNSVLSSKADIMIVDDTPDNIRFLSTLLQEQGYNVRKAINGKMALTAIRTVVPDLVLLDINMPMMNGYEVCQELKNDRATQTVPIIFISALNDVNDKVKAFDLGGADYITKPFQIGEVLARIQHQLTIKTLQNQLQSQNEKLQNTLEELRTAQAQIIQKEKMLSLSQLAAGMAHEVNNSIGFITGNLEFARQYIQSLIELVNLYQQEYPQPTPALQAALQEIDLEFIVNDVEKVLHSMQTGTERISTINLALRIFSRLNESDIKPVNLHEGIESTLTLLRQRLQQEGRKWEIKVEKNYGNLPAITCYASLMNQVFLNILNNAIDALESRWETSENISVSPTIWITTTETDRQSIIIKIKDNGIGVPENIRAQLFNPFFTTKPVGKGSGLGLLTSYQIVVEKHQGILTYQSQIGEGTEFCIEIPVTLTKT